MQILQEFSTVLQLAWTRRLFRGRSLQSCETGAGEPLRVGRRKPSNGISERFASSVGARGSYGSAPVVAAEGGCGRNALTVYYQNARSSSSKA